MVAAAEAQKKRASNKSNWDIDSEEAESGMQIAIQINKVALINKKR